MEINLKPIEILILKVQETVAETQNLSNQAISQIAALADEAPSAIASASVIATQEALKMAYHLRFENLPLTLQLKFARVGVRDGLRNIQEAAKVFETIPAQIRAQRQKPFATFVRIKIGAIFNHIFMVEVVKRPMVFLNNFGLTALVVVQI